MNSATLLSMLGRNNNNHGHQQYNTFLLKIFEVQHRYADLNTIISDFKKYQPPLI